METLNWFPPIRGETRVVVVEVWKGSKVKKEVKKKKKRLESEIDSRGETRIRETVKDSGTERRKQNRNRNFQTLVRENEKKRKEWKRRTKLETTEDRNNEIVLGANTFLMVSTEMVDSDNGWVVTALFSKPIGSPHKVWWKSHRQG